MKNKKGSFIYFYIMYFIILFIPVVLLGNILMYKIISHEKKQVDEILNSKLDDIIYTVEKPFEELDTLALNLSNNQWAKEIIYMQNSVVDNKRITPKEFKNYVQELHTYNVLNPITQSLAVLFSDKDFVISSDGICDAPTYFGELYKLENYDYYDIKSELQNNNKTNLLDIDILKLNIKGNYSHNTVEEEVITYINILNTYMKKNRAAMISHIPIKKLYSRIEEIADTNNCMVNIKMPQYSIELALGNQKTSEEYYKISKVSNGFDWEYVLKAPESIIFKQLNRLKIYIVLFEIIGIIAIIIISYFLAIAQHSSIKNLLKLVRQDFKENDKMTIGYNDVEKSIVSILEEEKRIINKSEKHKPLIRNALLMKLLQGVSINDINKQLFKDVNVEFDSKYYSVCLVLLDKEQNTIDELEKEYNYKHQNNKIYLMDLGYKVKAVIINHQNKEEIVDVITSLNDLIENKCGETLIITVGNSYSKIEQINTSYREAEKLLDYRVIDENKNIIFYKDISLEDGLYYYPISCEQKIMNLMNMGNINDAIKIIDKIYKDNIGNKGFRLIQAKYLAYELLGTAIRCINQMELKNKAKIDFQQLDKKSTYEQLLDYVKETYKTIGNCIANENKHEQNEFRKKIEDFIEQNYYLPNMSLTMVATYIGKPTYYVSRFYKKTFGTNFLDDLHKRRIEKSKQFLMSGNTIRETAEKVGYNNDVTFRRAFKKCEGKMPNEYQKTIRKNKIKIDL